MGVDVVMGVNIVVDIEMIAFLKVIDVVDDILPNFAGVMSRYWSPLTSN